MTGGCCLFPRVLAAIAGASLMAAAIPAGADPFVKGDIFASIGSGNVNHYSADGSFLETLNIGTGGFTTGMAFDGDGNLYVTGFSANTIAKFDTDGNLVDGNFITSAGGLSTPESIVFDKTGNIFVGNLGTGIQKYGSGGAFIGNVVPDRVDWLDLSADQSTFFFTGEGSTINTVSNALPGVDGPAFAGGLTQGFALRLLGDGGLLVADNINVKRFDSSGNLIQSYDTSGTGVDGWFALNLDPDGTSFWSGSFADGILRKFDIDSGSVLQSIDTTLDGGCAGNCLFGVAVAGEITQGGPGPGTVPEPSSLALMGGGLAGLWFVVRRKRIAMGHS